MPFSDEQVAILKATDPAIVRGALERMSEGQRAELSNAIDSYNARQSGSMNVTGPMGGIPGSAPPDEPPASPSPYASNRAYMIAPENRPLSFAQKLDALGEEYGGPLGGLKAQKDLTLQAGKAAGQTIIHGTAETFGRTLRAWGKMKGAGVLKLAKWLGVGEERTNNLKANIQAGVDIASDIVSGNQRAVQAENEFLPADNLVKQAGEYTGEIVGGIAKYAPLGAAAYPVLVAESAAARFDEALELDPDNPLKAAFASATSGATTALFLKLFGGEKAFKTLGGLVANKVMHGVTIGSLWGVSEAAIDKYILGKKMTAEDFIDRAYETTKTLLGYNLAGGVSHLRPMRDAKDITRKYSTLEDARADIAPRLADAQQEYLRYVVSEKLTKKALAGNSPEAQRAKVLRKEADGLYAQMQGAAYAEKAGMKFVGNEVAANSGEPHPTSIASELNKPQDVPKEGTPSRDSINAELEGPRYTPENLGGLKGKDLNDIGAEFGLIFTPKTKKSDRIQAILDEQAKGLQPMIYNSPEQANLLNPIESNIEPRLTQDEIKSQLSQHVRDNYKPVQSMVQSEKSPGEIHAQNVIQGEQRKLEDNYLKNMEAKNAIQERSPESQVSPVAEGGKDLAQGGGGVRPSQSGKEASGAGEAKEKVAAGIDTIPPEPMISQEVKSDSGKIGDRTDAGAAKGDVSVPMDTASRLSRISEDNNRLQFGSTPGSFKGVEIAETVKLDNGMSANIYRDGNNIMVVARDGRYSAHISGTLDGQDVIVGTMKQYGPNQSGRRIGTSLINELVRAAHRLDPRVENGETLGIFGGTGDNPNGIKAIVDKYSSALWGTAKQASILNSEILQKGRGRTGELGAVDLGDMFKAYDKGMELIKSSLGLDPKAKDIEIVKAVAGKIGSLASTVKMTAMKILSKIPGIGRDLAEKIANLLHNGTGELGGVSFTGIKPKLAGDVKLLKPVEIGSKLVVEPKAEDRVRRLFPGDENRDLRNALYNTGIHRTAKTDAEVIDASKTVSVKTAKTEHTWTSRLDPEQKEAVSHVFGETEKKTIKERVKEWKSDSHIEQLLVDKYAPLRDLDPHSYLLARMSTASDGTMEAAMLYGNLHLEDGVPNAAPTQEAGLIKILQPLRGEQDRFMTWIAANRAERLMGEGRENLFNTKDIEALKRLNMGKMDNGAEREAIYRQALSDFNKIGKSILDFAQESDIINAKDRTIWESDFYVPFYRAMDDGISGPNLASGGGLARQYAFKELKGGKSPLSKDLIFNTMVNWNHLIAASAKNRAAVSAIDAGIKMGIAERVESGTKGAVPILRGGRNESYLVSDPHVMESLVAMSSIDIGGTAMKVARKFKRALTIGVTANPAFKVRNLMRDSLAAVAISKISPNIPKNLWQGFKIMKNKGSQEYASILAGGGIVRFGTMLEGNTSKHVQRLVNAGVKANTIVTSWEHVKDWARKALDAYNELGDISEGINRAALYKQLRKKGLGHAEAVFQSRDMLDFTMGGTSKAVRGLTGVVPFLNARMQGVNKMRKSFKEQPGRMSAVLGATALASIALLYKYKDEDWWKQREDWDRDNFWAFKVGDTVLRMPKPFEVGAFGTLAERSVEMYVSDEMTKKRFMDRVGQMALDTFAMNPIPQVAKPMLDVYANKDPFTGRPIETDSMEKVDKSERFSERTSEIGKLVGKAEVLSPVQIDYLVRGYLGWLGSAALVTTSEAVRPFKEAAQPDRRLKDMFFVGGFAERIPSNESRYLTTFYDQAKEISMAMKTFKKQSKRGEAKPLPTGFMERYQKVNIAKKRMSEISAKIKDIYADTQMSGAEKRKEIDRLAAMKNDLAKQVVTSK